MRLYITYHSDTGNTEKVAQAIYAESRKHYSTTIQKMEDVDEALLKGCDILFVGAPCHMGDLSNKSKDFIRSIPGGLSCKIAGFITHAASLYNEDDYKKCFKSLENLCDEKRLQFLGCFNCRGYLDPRLHEMVKKSKAIGDEEWKKRIEDMREHPNTEDLEKAQAFARSVLLRE